MYIDSIIPHRKLMRLVTELVSAENGQTVALAHLDAQCPFLNEEAQLEPEAFIEILAQAFAAGAGACLPPGGLAGWGYLAGLRQIDVYETAQKGDTLRAVVRIVSQIGDIYVIEGELFCHERMLARGQLKIYVPQPEQAL